MANKVLEQNHLILATVSPHVQALITSPHVAQTADMTLIAPESILSLLTRCQQLASHHPMQHQNTHRLQIAPLSLSTIVADNNVVAREGLHALAQ